MRRISELKDVKYWDNSHRSDIKGAAVPLGSFSQTLKCLEEDGNCSSIGHSKWGKVGMEGESGQLDRMFGLWKTDTCCSIFKKRTM